MRNRKVVVRRHFFTSAIALLITVITLLILILMPKVSYVRYGTLYSSLSGDAVIIRSETANDLDAYDKLVFTASEGQLLEQDDLILSAYKRGYVETELENIIAKEQSIADYQNSNTIKDYNKPELTQLNFDISVIISQMTGNSDQIAYETLHKKLLSLMQQRQDYIRNNFSANGALQQLYDDENALLTSMEAWVDQLSAKEAAYVSYACDGLEATYSFDKISDLKASDIINTIKDTKANAVSDLSNSRSYKTVSPSKWYVVLPTKNKDFRDKKGQSYELYLNNNAKPLTGLLYNVINDYQDLLVFELTEGIESYLGQRVVSVSVGKNVTGFMVPAKYVVLQEQQAILHGQIAGKKQEIPVKVLYQNSEWAIVESADNKIVIDQKIYNK